MENLLQMIKKNQLQNILILQRLIALSNLIIDWNRSRHCIEYVSRIELLKINDNVLALYKYIYSTYTCIADNSIHLYPVSADK